MHIGKHKILPEMEITVSLRMSPDSFVEDITLNRDARLCSDAQQARLANIDMVDIRVDSKYRRDKLRSIVRLFELMDNLRCVQFSKIVDGAHFVDLLDDLRFKFVTVESLRLSRYGAASERLISEYFSAVTSLHAADTRPMHFASYRHQLKRFVISIADRHARTIDYSPLNQVDDNYEYARRIIENSYSLREVYIMVDDEQRYKYFLQIVRAWEAPGVREINVEWKGLGPKVNYVIVRDERQADDRRLIGENVLGLDVVLRGETDVPFNYLSVVVQFESHVKVLQGILERHRADLRHVELSTFSYSQVSLVLMARLFGVLGNLTEFSLEEEGSGDAIKKSTLDGGVTKLVATIPSGRHFELFVNAQIIALELGRTNKDQMSLFVDWLVQLADVVELTLADDNFALLAMTLARINRTGLLKARVRPWNQLKRLAARVNRGDEQILMPLIRLDMFPTLETIEFTVEYADEVDYVLAWFDDAGWLNVKIVGNTVTAMQGDILDQVDTM